MLLPDLTNAYLVNNRSLSVQIRMFDGGAIFTAMIYPDGDMYYKHLMVRTEGHLYKTIPVF